MFSAFDYVGPTVNKGAIDRKINYLTILDRPQVSKSEKSEPNSVDPAIKALSSPNAHLTRMAR